MTVVRGNKGVGKAIGGAAAPTATLAPVPINTPSVKRENNGRDPSVNLVPAARTTNSGVWGQNSSGNDDSPSDNRPTSQQPTPTSSTFSKPAPWAKASSRDAGGSTESAEALPPPPSRAPVTNWAEDVESDDDEDSSAAVPQSRVFHADRPSTSAPQFSRPSEADQRMRKDRSGSGSFGGDNYHEDGGRYGRGASGDARYSGSNYQNDYGVSLSVFLYSSTDSCNVCIFLCCCVCSAHRVTSVATPTALTMAAYLVPARIATLPIEAAVLIAPSATCSRAATTALASSTPPCPRSSAPSRRPDKRRSCWRRRSYASVP